MWTSEKDFENDLFSFSEIEGGRRDFEAPVPQSLLEWEATNGANQHRSVFDTPNLSEDATYIVSGRGRGGISTIIRPGEAPRASYSMEEEIRKKLREFSGPGFSNELIEEFVKHQQANLLGEVNTAIKLQPTTSTFNGSNRSTPNTTFRVHTPPNTSKASHSPRKSPSNSSVSGRSSRVSLEAEVEVEEAMPNPPPLSAILKKAKDDAKKKAGRKPTTTKKVDEDKNEMKENVNVYQDPNDYWWENACSDTSGELNCWQRTGDVTTSNRFFNKKKNFDIHSSEDFPGLK